MRTWPLNPGTRPCISAMDRKPGVWKACQMSSKAYVHEKTSAGPPHTFSSRSAGTMPKKGLMAIPGRISAPSSEGRGAMQMPPVSAGRMKRHQLRTLRTRDG